MRTHKYATSFYCKYNIPNWLHRLLRSRYLVQHFRYNHYISTIMYNYSSSLQKLLGFCIKRAQIFLLHNCQQLHSKNTSCLRSYQFLLNFSLPFKNFSLIWVALNPKHRISERDIFKREHDKMKTNLIILYESIRYGIV